MNISFVPGNLSFYSSPSYGTGFPSPSTSPIQDGVDGQTRLSGQMAGAGRTEAPEQAKMPGKTAARESAGGRAVPGQPDVDSYECQTCKNRKYKDGSNDPGVSFKTPTHVSPERAAFAVRSHEMEHVAHAKAKALKEDQEIVSQSVSYHTAICPECGRTYMAGGTTRTTFRSKPVVEEPPVEKGRNVDEVA